MKTILVSVLVAACGTAACGSEDATDYVAHPEACGEPASDPVAAGEYSLEWQCVSGDCDSPGEIASMPGSSEVISSEEATVSEGPNFPGVYFSRPGLWIFSRVEGDCMSLRSVPPPGGVSVEVGRLCSTSRGAFGSVSLPNSSWLVCATR